ncbi:DUF4232 domain-containing protein [Nocardioides albertanoniae]|nr:DUF4232 domain-containing protein [Nocardioides albertanoniae]
MTISIQRRVAPILLAATVIALAASACGSGTAEGAGEKADPSPSADSAESAASTEDPYPVIEVCAAEDLSFTVSEESQAGGYYLITATAKPGATCILVGQTISAGFGSDPSGDVAPSEQAEGESITMSGSTKAYAGVNPHSGAQDGGVQFEEIIVGAHKGDMSPVSLKLPSTAEVDQPIGTNWHTDAAKAVPFAD